MSQASATSTGQRAADWASTHRRAIYVGAALALAAAGTAGYMLYSSPQSSGAGGSSSSSSATGPTKTTKRRKTKRKDGSSSTPATGDNALDSSSNPALSDTELDGLTNEQRTARAAELKAKGNALYAKKQWEDARDLYSEAIRFAPQAVFYSNRAACHAHLGDNEATIRDCTDALRLQPEYQKALTRRASAHLALGGREHMFQAVCDYTAASVLGGFEDQSVSDTLERTLQDLARLAAMETMASKEPTMPSTTFISAFLDAFRSSAPLVLPEKPSQGDRTLKMALEAVDAHDYAHAMTLMNEAVEQGPSTPQLQARALNMRSTFAFISGRSAEALADLDRATELDPSSSQSWVKKASVHMELGDATEAMADFDRALKIDPRDPDIYYHRGQVHFIQGQYDEAMEQYDESTKLDDSFIFSKIQHAVARYKRATADPQNPNTAEIHRALAEFKRMIREQGETTPQVHTYLGEILLDQEDYDKASESFQKAIDIDRAQHANGMSRLPQSPLPLVNRALTVFRGKDDKAQAIRLCKLALELDPACDIAVATLAQLYLQQGKLDDAIELFGRSAELARTEQELIGVLQFDYATRSQRAFMHNYPEQARTLLNMRG